MKSGSGCFLMNSSEYRSTMSAGFQTSVREGALRVRHLDLESRATDELVIELDLARPAEIDRAAIPVADVVGVEAAGDRVRGLVAHRVDLGRETLGKRRAPRHRSREGSQPTLSEPLLRGG